jgi:hypothetical protein
LSFSSSFISQLNVQGQSVVVGLASFWCFTRCDFSQYGLQTYNHVALFTNKTILTCFHSPDHWQDLVAGTALGLTTAYFSYRQYYPSLVSKLSHLPYSPRIELEDAARLPIQPLLDSIQEPFDRSVLGDEIRQPSQDLDLDRTVRRGGPGSFEEVWREGERETIIPV